MINKIDLPSADVENCKKEIEEIIGLPANDVPCISAKEGINIESVLQKIITEFHLQKVMHKNRFEH